IIYETKNRGVTQVKFEPVPNWPHLRHRDAKSSILRCRRPSQIRLVAFLALQNHVGEALRAVAGIRCWWSLCDQPQQRCKRTAAPPRIVLQSVPECVPLKRRGRNHRMPVENKSLASATAGKSKYPSDNNMDRPIRPESRGSRAFRQSVDG